MTGRIHVASAAIVLGAFLAGAAAGAGVHAWLVPPERPRRGPPPGGPPPRGLPPYLRELDLTPEQERAAQAIFERHRAAIDAVMRESMPRVQAIDEKVEEELAAILRPEQKAQLAELRKRRPPPPPPPPGGPGGPGDPGRPPPPGPPPGPPPPR
jgi:Spy/CpxP family protein refolding chaperone